MPVEKLKQYLDSNKIKYTTISHSPAYTAQEIAASAHVSGWELAKTVMVKLDGKMAMAVLTAPQHLDLQRLKKAAGAKNAQLAGEQDFAESFPTCELGAMPPFGNLYEMGVYADESLREHEHIVFNAGSHTELIRLAYGDFEKRVNPKVAQISARGS